ncbi:MAG: ATP-binding cassette domain-containing protein [Ignavibacteriales bacterium]|nr:ATP-binding cassette domain-containing protein [Ignavibacteriales bacterium]
MAKDFNVDQEALGKAYDGRLMRRLLKYLKPYRKYVVLAILLHLFTASLGPLRPYLTKIAVDDHIATKDYGGLAEIVALIFGALFLQAIIQYVLMYLTQWIGQKTILDLRKEIFAHVQRLAASFFDKTPVGRLVTRTTNDVEALNQMFGAGVVTAFSDVFIVGWILAFMFYTDVELSFVTLAALPLLVYGTFVFKKKAREAYRDVRLHLARLNAYMQEHVAGAAIVQLFGKERREAKRYANINADHRQANYDSILYHAVFFPFVELVSALALALIVWHGGGLAKNDVLTLGVLFAFIQYVEMFFRPIRDLAEKYNIMQTAMASSERVFKLLDDETVVRNPERSAAIERARGEVEFQHVSLSYLKDGKHALRDFSLKIAPGETVALVGHTGAGKSTVINVLLRFYDHDEGRIFIDGTDAAALDERELRRHIGVAPQDVSLFQGTIRSNITMNNPDISEERMIEAAKATGAHEFIERLPNGYDETVAERGATLSVGQKQLISFARALAHDPEIIALDEATSSVDAETEGKAQAAVEKLLEGRTSIVVAHRLSTIQSADRIVVMHKGRVREIGSHQELLAQKGIYHRLYRLQYKDQAIDAS